ncbi:MAG: hypothetical protein ACJ789_00305 [Thermomicrobiales bacterium]
MVIGSSRPRTREDARSIIALDSARRSAVAADWHATRGAIRYEISCDLFGGFPGFAQCGGAQSGAHLRISDHFLLVDDGKATGFGLPISWLEGAVVFPLQQREEPGLRIFYQDGACPRVFTVRFRGGRLSMRAHRRAEHSLNLLISLGMNDRYTIEAPVEPNFRVPWDQTRQFELENVVWTGTTTAPLQVGLDAAPADVWLTTKSLIWGSPGGDGINRVPLPLVQDVITAQVDDRQKTPAVYISFGDESTGRYDLAFLFDRYDAERNLRERGAFLVGLRSRGIPLGAPVPLYQPWRITNPTVVAQPALPRGTDELPTMERPLRRRRGSISRLGSRHGDRVEEPTWGDTFAPENEDADLELYDAADPVWPVTFAPTPYLRVVDESYQEPTSTSGFGQWDEAPAADDRWDDEQDRSRYLQTAVNDVFSEPIEAPINVESAFQGEDCELEHSDVMLTEFAGADESDEPSSGNGALGDYELATDWLAAAQTEQTSSPLSPATAPLTMLQREGDDVEEPARVSPTAAPSKAFSTIEEYEASCLAVLGEVLRAIDDRVSCRPAKAITEPLPSSSLQASAIAALIELTANGEITMDDARWRKARLIALSESGVRLRALMELRDYGHITTQDLDLKKESITAHLSSFVRADP